MTLYSYQALAQQSWPSEMPIGSIPIPGDLTAITRAATVLSNLRWSATVALPPGVTFSSGRLGVLAPVASSGRQNYQVILQSPNTLSTNGVQVRSMTGASTSLSVTGSNYSITNPTDLRGTTGGTWRSSARIYPTSVAYGSLTSGCPRVEMYGLSGSSPMAISLIGWSYPGSVQSGSLGYAGIRADGSLMQSWPDVIVSSMPMCAGWARTIESMLDMAEAMPVVIGMLPRIEGATGLPTWDEALMRRIMGKQIPLAPPRRRPKALYCALKLASSSSAALRVRVGGQIITTWSTVYQSTYGDSTYLVLRASLADDAYRADGEVGGVPVVSVEMLPSLSTLSPEAATMWIGEDV